MCVALIDAQTHPFFSFDKLDKDNNDPKHGLLRGFGHIYLVQQAERQPFYLGQEDSEPKELSSGHFSFLVFARVALLMPVYCLDTIS